MRLKRSRFRPSIVVGTGWAMPLFALVGWILALPVIVVILLIVLVIKAIL